MNRIAQVGRLSLALGISLSALASATPSTPPARTATAGPGFATQPGSAAEPYLTLDPAQASPGQMVTVRGQHFCPTLTCGPLTLQQDDTLLAADITVDADGSFSATLPAARRYGTHEIAATQQGPDGALRDAKYLIVGRIEAKREKDSEEVREYFPPPPPSNLPSPEAASATAFQPNIGWGGRAVAVDVNPTNVNEAWVAAESGGLFKTTNGGATWAHYGNTVQFRMADVKYVTTDGQWVIATSTYDTRSTNQGGILLSTNDGASWYHPASASVSCATAPRASAYGIAVVTSANEVYVGTDCGLAISRDKGATWTHVSNWNPGASPGTYSVIARANGANRIVDICGDYGHRRSLDSGVTWTTTSALLGDCTGAWSHALASSPSEPNVLFAAVNGAGLINCGGALYFDERLYESDNGGLSWTPVIAQYCPNRPALVYTRPSRDGVAGHFDVYFGDGVGMSRQICIAGGPGNRCSSSAWSSVTLSHADPAAMAWGWASNCPLYVVGDGGPSTSTLVSCGAAWTAVGGGNAGFNALQVYEVANQVHPGATDVYFGTQDNSLWASSDSGVSWPYNTCCEGFFLQMARNTASSVGQTLAYAACGPCSNLGSGPYFGGEYLWNNPPGGGGNPVFVAAGVYLQWSVPNAPTNTVSQLYLTTNTGGSWTPVAGATIAQALWGPPRLAGSASNPVALQPIQRAGGGIGLRAVFNTRSGVPSVSGDLLPAGDISIYCMGQGTFICPAVYGVNPTDSNHIIYADKVSSTMKVTRNGGASWTTDWVLTDQLTDHGAKLFSAGGLLQPHFIQWDPTNPNRIFVSTDEAGTIMSLDNGASWGRLKDSTQIINASNFAFDEARGRVIAASYGRGLWILDTTTADVSIQKTAAAVSGAQIRYAITVTNNGPLDLAERVVFTDVLPAGTTFDRLTVPTLVGWSCSTPPVGAGGTVSCINSTGVYSSYGPQVISLVVDSSALADGVSVCNTASVRSDSPDPNMANNASQACTLIRKLTVDRSDDLNITACTTAPNDCTLRGAINKVHLLGGAGLAIDFDPAVSQVNLTASLPPMTATGTSVRGRMGTVIINAAGIASGDTFALNGNEQSLSLLSIVNSFGSDVRILSGAQNELDSLYLGVTPATTNNCGGLSRQGQYGIFADPVSSSASSFWLHNSVIGCHTAHGVLLYGTDDAKIGVAPDTAARGNLIGIGPTGELWPNAVGIAVLANGSNGARRNALRNNEIANNRYAGIWLSGTGSNNINSTSSNVLTNNRVHHNASVNGAGGVYLSNASFLNGIGGSGDGDANLIYGNTGNGISVYGSDANGILGNVIGAVYPATMTNNSGDGILLSGSSDNWLGGIFVILAVFEQGNVIGGNTGNGIHLADGTHGTSITRNWIGARPDGWLIPNDNGVLIDTGAYSNTIGDGTVDRLNVIGGNVNNGVRVVGANTLSNSIRLNDIGLSSALAAGPLAPSGPAPRLASKPSAPLLRALANGAYGVMLDASSRNTLISDGNWIGKNVAAGIGIFGDANHNTIGPGDSIFDNLGSGIEFGGPGTAWNTVITDSVSHNGYDGIEEWGGAHDNRWLSVAAYANGGLGIDKDTPTAQSNVPTPGWPVITQVIRSAGDVTLIGTSDAFYFGALGSNSTHVYVFRDGLDISGYGEGQTYMGVAAVDAQGIWQITLSEGAVPRCYAAYKNSAGYFWTLSGFAYYDYGSEFSPSTCTPPKAYLPIIAR